MLKGKNAVVTGARRGIGRSVVEIFAENGANIWACARTNEPGFEEDMTVLSERYGVWIEPIYFDLADDEQIMDGVRRIQKKKVPVDILINNAGVVDIRSIQMTSPTMLKNLFQVNFFSQVLLMQSVARLMMRNKSGAIVNISSVAGLDGEAATLSYGSSKAAIAYASRAAAKDLAPSGIRVNAVAPGYVQTDMFQQLPEASQKSALEKIALNRYALPREVAEIILYLASDKASYITGQIIRVDGGL